MVKEFVTRGKHAAGDVKIWRYMDFTKFISLLSRKELFFPRADKPSVMQGGRQGVYLI